MLHLDTPKQHVALTGRVSEWLGRAGVNDADARATLAVGLVDSLAAAHQVAADLERLLELDPDTAGDADQALQLAANMHAWLFTELKVHVAEMEAVWEPAFEEELVKRCSPEEEDDDDLSGRAAT
jgi:hypothetical protein